MRYFILYGLMALFPLFLLSGCGGAGNSDSSYGMTPFPSGKMRGPSDEVLAKDVAQYVARNTKPASTTYQHARIDLNGDGLLDALVLFTWPHQSWCGWDGCVMGIFKAGSKSFTPVGSVSGVRGPIYVRKTGHNGWRDIIVRISGMEIRDKNVSLIYNGYGYPPSPMAAPTLQVPVSALSADVFFK